MARVLLDVQKLEWCGICYHACNMLRIQQVPPPSRHRDDCNVCHAAPRCLFVNRLTLFESVRELGILHSINPSLGHVL